jgi:hypothetical protein
MSYGNVLSPVQVVMGQQEGHEVRFAISPTIIRWEYEEETRGKEGVVHNAMVHIMRMGWA